MSALIPGEQHQAVQTARAPKRSEAGLILPIPHSLVCNPVCGRGMKYRCRQRAGSTRQWCDQFCSTVAKRGQCEWPTKGCWRSLTMTATAAFYRWGAENCGTASTSLAYRRSSSKEGFVRLVMPQGVPTVNWSRTYFCPQRLARGAYELEASWRLGQPRSKQTWSSSPDHESSATHDGERTGRTSLVNLHRTAEPGVYPSETRSAQLVMPAQPAPGECRHKYK